MKNRKDITDMDASPEGLQNLGEIVRAGTQDVKTKSKIQLLESQIQEAKVLLKTLNPMGTMEDAITNLRPILEIFYKGKEVESQLKSFSQREPKDLVWRAFSMMVYKKDRLQKLQDDLLDSEIFR